MNKYNYKIIHHDKEHMISSMFPFIVDHKKKKFGYVRVLHVAL